MTGLRSIIVIPALAVIGVLARESSHSSSIAGPTITADTTACLDTLHAGDSLTLVVTMRVRPQDSAIKLPADFEGLFVQEFRSRFKVPSNLPLTVMTGWAPCDTVSHRCESGILWLGEEAYVTAHPTGTLSRLAVVDASLTPALADSVRTVLQRMSADKAVPFFSAPDSIPLDVALGLETNPDSVPRYRHVFRVKIPHYAFPFTHADMSTDYARPAYPRNALAASVGDSVKLTFTILPDGSVAPKSVDFRAGRYLDFMQSIFDWMPKVHYIPGRIGSCPVATWQTQSFVFKMRR